MIDPKRRLWTPSRSITIQNGQMANLSVLSTQQDVVENSNLGENDGWNGCIQAVVLTTTLPASV